ncbi:MAG: SDR family oxidoreductase [Ruminiclostridium sp.]|nr:SDR family oxidoreductase [Ruminiclostridium sp.]
MVSKTAVITGGTGAIGLALVGEFAKDYNVIFTYRENEKAARDIAERYGASAVKCDLTNAQDIYALAERADGCSLLINNAGISQIKLFTDVTDAELDTMISSDLTGTMRLTREICRKMIRGHEGCIINISSVWGVHGASCEVAYSAAKAGLIGFTKALAKELGPSGIRVNCIAPGVIESRMNAHLSPDEMAELIDSTPLMRIGKPEDISHAARFLESSGFTTGQTIGIDGGFM